MRIGGNSEVACDHDPLPLFRKSGDPFNIRDVSLKFIPQVCNRMTRFFRGAV